MYSYYSKIWVCFYYWQSSTYDFLAQLRNQGKVKIFKPQQSARASGVCYAT